MTPEEATQIQALALAAYPTQAGKIGEKAIAAMRAMWVDLLDDLDFTATKAALVVYCRTNKFLPSPAELRELVASGGAAGRSGMEAWGDVTRAVSRYGVHRRPVFEDPIVAEVVEAIGWEAICSSESAAADRAHFARAYDSAAARQRRQAQVGTAAAQQLAAASSAGKLAESLAGRLAAPGSARLELVPAPAPRKAGAR